MLSTLDVLDSLQRFHLLESQPLDELRRRLDAHPADARSIARDLIQRGLLTPYQANHLLQGRGQELVLGSYVLLERLGSGGMGQVFKARNWKLGHVVAIKLLRTERLDSPDAVRRFHREIRAAAQLDHPNIVRTLDADEVNGVHLLVMEFVPGVDLARHVKQHGPASVADACEYARQAALGLHHAHERGIIHRDIKPHNLLLCERPDGSRVVKVLDVGLARVTTTTTDGESVSTLTVEGAVMGTPDYIAPEQAMGSHDVDCRTDLYSLGCTLYFLLSGRPPFPSGTLGAKLVRHKIEEPEPIERVRPGIPNVVAAVVRHLMAKQPGDRPANAAEAAAELDAARAGLPFAAPTPIPVAPENEHEETLDGSRTTARLRPRAPLGSWLLVAASWLFLLCGVVAIVGWSLFVARGRESARTSTPRPSATETAANPTTTAPTRDPIGLEQLKPLAEISGYTKRISDVAFSPDGRTVVTISSDEGVRFTDLATRKMSASVPGTQGGGVAFLPSGSRFVVTSHRNASVRKFPGGDRLNLLEGLPGYTSSVAAFPDGLTVAINEDAIAGSNEAVLARADYGVHLWGPLAGSEGRVLKGPRQPLRRVAVSPDGRFVAAGGWEPVTFLWDLKGEPPYRELGIARTRSAVGVHFSPDGQRLARCSRGGQVALFDTFSGKLTNSFQIGEPEPLDFQDVRYSPDGRVLALAANDGRLLLVNPEHQAVIAELVGHREGVYRVAFSPDGRTLASVGSDTVLRLWDVSKYSGPPRFGPWRPLWNGVDLEDWPSFYESSGGVAKAEFVDEDGERMLRITGNNTTKSWTRADTVHDFHVRVEFRIAEGGKGEASLHYHVHGDGYTFAVASSGSAALNCYKGDARLAEEAELREGRVVAKGTPATSERRRLRLLQKLSEGWHRLELICRESAALHLLDGELLAATLCRTRTPEGRELPVTEGRLGLGTYGPGPILFRRLQIRSITELPSEVIPH